jgi:hypothetical protein
MSTELTDLSHSVGEIHEMVTQLEVAQNGMRYVLRRSLVYSN